MSPNHSHGGLKKSRIRQGAFFYGFLSIKYPRPRIFYGWWIVCAGMICMMLAGGIGYYAFGAFFIPLTQTFGWTRVEISLAMTMTSFVGLAAPLVGFWVDRYGARIVMAVGALVTACAVSLLGLTHALWYFYAVYILMASGHFGILNIPVTKLVSDWFVEKRGFAIGITLTGYGLGGLTMLPLAGYLIASVGWRSAYIVLGLIIGLVLVPLCLFVVIDKPEEKGLFPDGASRRTPDSAPDLTPSPSLKQVLKTGTFWLLAGSLTLAFFATAGLIAHAIPWFQDHGIGSQQAASMLAVSTGVSIIGRISAGYLGDRVSVTFLTAFFFMLQVLALFFLLSAPSMVTAWLFVITLGLAMGGMFATEPLLIAKYFGLDSFGAIYGGVWAIETIGWAGGAPFAGYIFDVTGTYNPAFLFFILTTFIAAILVFLLGRITPLWPAPKVPDDIMRSATSSMPYSGPTGST